MLITINHSLNPFKNITEVEGDGRGPAQFIYVTSNEIKKQEVLNTLAKQPISGDVIQLIQIISFAFSLFKKIFSKKDPFSLND